MFQKLNTILLVVLIGIIGYLAYNQMQLQKQIVALSNNESNNDDEVNITPAEGNHTTPQADKSPFDKPNTDPMSDAFPPDSKQAPAKTSIKFNKMTHNFGRINEGSRVTTTFKFTNTGPNPLIISDARGSCGCTVPVWPKHPIQPGESDEIEVTFNSEGKTGEQQKMVTIVANIEPSTRELIINSTVIPADK
jgi:hypothetical protein